MNTDRRNIGIMFVIGVGLGLWTRLQCGCGEPPVCSGDSDFDGADPTPLPKKKVKKAQARVVTPGNLAPAHARSKVTRPPEPRLSPVDLPSQVEVGPSLPARMQRFLVDPVWRDPVWRDLAKWGTKEGVMEVADLSHPQRMYDKLVAIQEGRIQSLGTPSHLKQVDRYLKDLKRWGTREGIIDVSNDEAAAKKKTAQLQQMARQGQLVSERYPKRKNHSVTQVTIQNTTSQTRTVSLWEGNRADTVSPATPTDIEDLTLLYEQTIDGAVHPQGMAFNPANQLTYVANQLSNNVSVVDDTGRLVARVALEPDTLPGANSPVAVAIHTNPDSNQYGYAYVIGSVANTVSVINLQLEVIATVPVGVRPLAVAFNPVNERVYVSNYVSGTVSIMDTNDLNQVSERPVGRQPRGIGINAFSGEVWVANSGDDSLTVFTENDEEVTEITSIGREPIHLVYQPITQEFLVGSALSEAVTPVDAVSYTTAPVIPVGVNVGAMAYHAANGFVYVVGKATGQLIVLSEDRTVRAVLDAGPLNNGLAVHPERLLLFTSFAATNTVRVWGYEDVDRGGIIIDDDYEEKRRDFQHNPAIVRHATFILSGDERFSRLRLRESHSRGNSTQQTISFTNYRHPQNFQNVSEVSELDGAVIDGSNGWDFEIAGGQTITLVIYYQKFERYSLLPETSRKSTGVEMSKGISEQWTDPNSNYDPIT